MDDTKRKDLPSPVPMAMDSQSLAPGLWIVATPIGNLMDFSPRGRMALAKADAILCEDTRRTSRLIAGLGLSKSLLRMDEHAEKSEIKRAIARMRQGESLAFVSDAGTPGISDPAAALVTAAHENGITVTPIPGPSAVVALLSVCGFQETGFSFRGFFPRKTGDRKKELEGLSGVFVWFESPERIVETLGMIAEISPGAHAVVAKELTKIHEKIFSAEISVVANDVRAEILREGKLGEWCFAIRFQTESVDSGDDVASAQVGSTKSSDWVKALHCLINVQVSASDAAREVSQTFGVSKKSVYEMALKLSGKK